MKLNPLFDFCTGGWGWHIEHHMFAGIPATTWRRYIRKWRTICLSAYANRRLERNARTWRRQKIDPDYQYDTPLPATAKEAREDAPDQQLEGSIGELAPAGLLEQS